MQLGDLLKNKTDGQLALIVAGPWVKFFPDQNHCNDFDSGVAATALRIKWIDGGFEKTYKRSSIQKCWDLISSPDKKECSK
ncbi:hypothetical protein OAA09_01130 [bacterium]|nr:hypothetical protein [bacterium]